MPSLNTLHFMHYVTLFMVLQRNHYPLGKYYRRLSVNFNLGDSDLSSGGGGYSMDDWVGRCSSVVQTLTLFKTQFSDFISRLTQN